MNTRRLGAAILILSAIAFFSLKPFFRFEAADQKAISLNGKALKPVEGLRYKTITENQIETGFFYPNDGKREHAVMIVLASGGMENPEVWDKRESSVKWDSISKNMSIGLTEYRKNSFDGAWGYVTLVDYEGAVRTPLGSLIRFECEGIPNGKVGSCRSSYLSKHAVMVTYYINYENIKNWKAIQNQVTAIVDEIFNGAQQQ